MFTLSPSKGSSLMDKDRHPFGGAGKFQMRLTGDEALLDFVSVSVPESNRD